MKTNRLNKFRTLENHRYLELIVEQFEETPIDECIEWPFAPNTSGYGQVKSPNTQKVELVHREAYFLYYGEYPEPCGLHTCDNPPCFNPHHIYEGTPADNGRDRREKPVRHIKHAVGQSWDLLLNLVDENPSDAEIARQFDITEENVRELREYLHPKPKSRPRKPDPELTDEQTETILGLSQRGFPKREIAFWFDIPVRMVNAIAGGRTWSHLPRPEED